MEEYGNVAGLMRPNCERDDYKCRDCPLSSYGRDCTNEPIVKSLAGAADYWGLHRVTVSQACREGRLECERVGRMYTTTHQAMHEAIEAGKLRPHE